MMSRLLLLVAVAIAVLSAEGFAPRTAFFRSTFSTVAPTSLFASRVNAKKEKIKRNRENMRKFSSPGRKGTTRRKTLKKIQASNARQVENEFIARCFITGPAPSAGDE